MTNQLQYLPRADLVIYLENGRVAEQGSYEDVLQNANFASLLKEFNSRVTESDNSDTEVGFFAPSAQCPQLLGGGCSQTRSCLQTSARLLYSDIHSQDGQRGYPSSQLGVLVHLSARPFGGCLNMDTVHYCVRESPCEVEQYTCTCSLRR